jgi:2-oxoglutarate dehydrogenase E1 component
VEQLYPFPAEQLKEVLSVYKQAKEIIWCQEEPQNQGAWYQTQHYFIENIRPDQKLYYAGRASAAAPAVGYAAKHHEQLKRLIDMAFGEFEDEENQNL